MNRSPVQRARRRVLYDASAGNWSDAVLTEPASGPPKKDPRPGLRSVSEPLG